MYVVDDLVLTHLICHIIYNYDAVSPTVVTRGDCTKPLLTSSVPLRNRQTHGDTKGEKDTNG